MKKIRKIWMLQVQSHLDKCIYQGTLSADPDSKIIVDQCNKECENTLKKTLTLK
jgi:hypothetical protein